MVTREMRNARPHWFNVHHGVRLPHGLCGHTARRPRGMTVVVMVVVMVMVMVRMMMVMMS